MSSAIETRDFQAETKQLLEIVIHSLYTTKEIFLRELISNASDALDRLRFEALTRPELIDESNLEIHLETDPAARTLTIYDNGIGMSRAEVIENIGTLAKSSTRELREQIKAGASAEELGHMIGQFGVGFYSAFMVADRVTLVTRRAGEEQATRWESTGDGQYTISETIKSGRGTSVTLHLKPVDPENGIEDFTDQWVLSRIVRQYSDFVTYPIIYKGLKAEDSAAENGNKPLNTMKPIWRRPQGEVTDEQYADFYKHLAHDMSEPLKTIPLRAEGNLEYQSLLFIPANAPFDLFYHGSHQGLRLYAQGVLIQETCEELLPGYLRFVRGLVDTMDLPLNISRQMLQQDRQITQIRKWLTRKVLDVLQTMYNSEYDKYLQFWRQFGRAFKEGVSSDYDNKEKIVSLVLFDSSYDAGKLTTLQNYVDRMPEEQTEIFYLTGESRRVIENSPHLEVFREKGYEVLYLVDPVDELVVQSLTEFGGKKLRSVIKGEVSVGDEAEKEKTAKELKELEEASASLLEALQKELDEHVKQVRLSNRLTSSPVCLVGAEFDYSPQLERLLQKGKGGGPKQRRIMELNPKHPIFKKLQERFQQNAGDKTIGNYAQLLLGYALIAEGSELPDPVRFNQLVAEILEQVIV
jgi:molecular chaperone HtpG